MRLIDADALKIAIDDVWIPDMMVSEIWGVIDEAQTVVTDINVPDKWTSAKDRLPKKDEDVIIYGKFIGASGTEYPETHITDIDEFVHSGYVPIAWMPLPEPPKEDDDEKGS